MACVSERTVNVNSDVSVSCSWICDIVREFGRTNPHAGKSLVHLRLRRLEREKDQCRTRPGLKVLLSIPAGVTGQERLVRAHYRRPRCRMLSTGRQNEDARWTLDERVAVQEGGNCRASAGVTVEVAGHTPPCISDYRPLLSECSTEGSPGQPGADALRLLLPPQRSSQSQHAWPPAFPACLPTTYHSCHESSPRLSSQGSYKCCVTVSENLCMEIRRYID